MTQEHYLSSSMRPNGLSGDIPKPDNGDDSLFLKENDNATKIALKQAQQDIDEKASKAQDRLKDLWKNKEKDYIDNLRQLSTEDLRKLFNYDEITTFLEDRFVDQVCNALRYHTVNEQICANRIELQTKENTTYTSIIQKLQSLEELTLKNMNSIVSRRKIGQI